MKWFDELKDSKLFRVIVVSVIGLFCFGFVMNMFYVLGEINVCANMNGTIVKDSGYTVCIFTDDIPLCTDGLGSVYRDLSNDSFDYSSVIID